MDDPNSLAAMQVEYGLLLNAQVSAPILPAISLRILAREIQREEAKTAASPDTETK